MGTWIKRKQSIILTVLALVVLAGSAFLFIVLNNGSIYSGISIDGIDVSGMSKQQALAYLEKEDNVNEKNIKLKYINGEEVVSFEKLDCKINFKAAVDKAWNMGRNGNIISRLSEIYKLRNMGKNIDSSQNLNVEKLTKILQEIKNKSDKKPENAYLSFNKKNMTLIPENIGYSLNVKKSLEIIDENITNKENSIIKLDYTELKPDVKSDILKYVNHKLGEYSTKFNNLDSERNNNMVQACNRINSELLLPGQTFSMNEKLGPRTLANGFKEAKIIINNELVDGIGGGVCQVVSTLYNSVLLSRLQVVERTSHSIPLAYVGPGRDATISEDDLDFKFKNNKEYPICINAYVSGNTISISIYGKNEGDNSTVKLVSEKTKEFEPDFEELYFDDKLKRGIEKLERKAVNGYVARVYRIIYNKSGDVIKTEKISEDYYKPVRAKLRIGIAG
jgi:vancomycin resistance protein YoaR